MNVRAIFLATAALSLALVILCDARPYVPASSFVGGGARLQFSPAAESLRLPVEGGFVTLTQTAASLNVQASPAALNNPTSLKGTMPSQTFTVKVVATGLNGDARKRRGSGSQPMVTITVYGPAGAVTPATQTVPLGNNNTATAQFTYNGVYFANPMTIAAVLGNGSMTAPLLRANKVPCKYSNTPAYYVSESNPLKYGVSGGFHIGMSIAGGQQRNVQLDTGSTGFLIAASALPKSPSQTIVGPGQIGFETLEPSGITLVGHYWLAPVALYDNSTKIDQTIPMEVLAVEFSCKPGSSCQPETQSGKGQTGLMGIGFGRPTPPPGQVYIKTPLENVFLQLADEVQGNVHAGYILSSNHLWLGLNNADTINFAPSTFEHLKPFKQRSGDWKTEHGCLNFNGSGWQCGTLLVDIGIDSMIASGFHTPSPLTQITVAATNPTTPALEYTFPYPVPSDATPPAPDPNGISQGHSIEWLAGSGKKPFVNVGRDPIAVADYLYDSQCGRVGFGVPVVISPSPSPSPVPSSSPSV